MRCLGARAPYGSRAPLLLRAVRYKASAGHRDALLSRQVNYNSAVTVALATYTK